MIRTMPWLIAVVLLLAPGCAHKQAYLGEPGDPNGDGARLSTRPEEDPLPGLLASTTLNFGFDDATLSVVDRRRLSRIAQVLRVRPWAAIRIAGHCDERGTEEYNLALGERRAEAAGEYLLHLGVTREQLETISFGEVVPLVEEQTEEAWAANRRAEFGPKPLEFLGDATDDAAPAQQAAVQASAPGVGGQP
jgi:peptidoglycan-associated lipoprotein